MSTDNNDLTKINVRTFTSIDEIENEPGFIKSNLVNSDNYWGIIGDYNFKEEELQCCCQHPKTGHLCNQDHKKGFVVILKDKTISILGNSCIRTKFDPNANIITDTKNYAKKQDHLRNLELIDRFLLSQTELFKQALEVNSLLDEALKFRDGFLSLVDKETKNNIRKRIKDRNYTAYIDSDFYIEWPSHDDEELDDTSVDEFETLFYSDKSVPISIEGLSLFDNFYTDRAKREISNAISALEQIPELKQNGLSKATAEWFLKAMEKFDIKLKRCIDVHKDFEKFSTQNFIRVYFLPKSTRTRTLLSKYILKHQGLPDNDEYIKSKLDEIKSRIREHPT